MKNQRITKSKFITGTQCQKKLWLDCNKEYKSEVTIPGSTFDIGNKVGTAATKLFPGGVMLGKEYTQAEALSKTSELIKDPNTSAIFEAAFSYNETLVRVDILERVGDSTWRLIEVKSAKNLAKHHEQDAAFQAWVLRNAGIELSSIEIAHPNGEYIRETDEIDYAKFIIFDDITSEANSQIEEIESTLLQQFKVLESDQAPVIQPVKRRCSNPYPCDYWSECTKDKPTDWIQKIYFINADDVESFAENGIESVAQLPKEYSFKGKRKDIQETEVKVMGEGKPVFSEHLADSLSTFGPPAHYLDFEFTTPAIPLFKDTKSGELIAFQWSCHFIQSQEDLLSMTIDDMLDLDDKGPDNFHWEFLAEDANEPSIECARRLLEAVGKDEYPILVHHANAEERSIKSLANRCPEYRNELLALLPRLRDLLPVVRENACLPGFFKKPLGLGAGTYSIKTTANAFNPEFDYANLSDVSQGASATEAYYRLVTGEFTEKETEESLRDALLKYCQYDTVAMMVLHKELLKVMKLSDEKG